MINVVSGEGTEPGKLKEPSSIAMGPDGSIWVADSGNNRIEQWSSSLTFVRQFGTEGTGNGQFKRPAALEVDLAGDVWVGDQNNNRVQEFSERGEFLRRLGSTGTNSGQFTFGQPIGLAVDGKGNLWVADGNNNRVQKWIFPALSIGPALALVTASGTDTGSGVTALTVRLVNETKQVETLESSSQSCPEGGCSMKSVFEALDLSEKPAGTYTLIVEAVDGAGNSNRTSSRFTLSPEPPRLSLSGALAEGAGQPMSATAGELTINASETASQSSGVRRVSVEVDDQQVASQTFNCTAGCQEVATSYRYDAKRDGAGRSIEAAATPSGAAAKSLSGISCLNASDCTAVGYYKSNATNLTLIEHWNGTSWQVVPSPNPASALESRLEGVSCSSTASCVAVGYYQTSTGFSTLAERWNGSEWSIGISPNASGFARNYLYSASCVSAADCWAVGKSAHTTAEEASGKTPAALLEHWNGSEWATAPAPSQPRQLQAISCYSTSSCMAVSGSPDLSAEAWNGSMWLPLAGTNPSGGSAGTLTGVACTAASSCTAVGSYFVNGHTAPLAERWNGASFAAQKTTDPVGTIEEATSASLNAISCWTASACTAVGTRNMGSESAPLIEGWDGTDWALQQVAVPSGAATAALTGAACVEAFNCYAVGSKAGNNALVEREIPDQGSKTVTVEATDRYGNATTKSIEVDVPQSAMGTPTCDQEAASVAPKAVVTATEATNSLQNSVPRAVAASEAMEDGGAGEEIDPSYSQPKPNLESLGTPTEGETQVTPEGGFTIKGVACIAPTAVTTASTEAKVVNGDAAVFANTAPETDTLLRPNAAGMTMVQSLRGSSAPTRISWNVALNPDENLVELPSGAVAVTHDGTEATGETPEIVEPEGMHSAAVLNDAELQQETSQYQLIKAEAETPEEVVAVIPQPWIILHQGSIMPLKIAVEPDAQIPNEYTMTYEYPPFEPSFEPVAVVSEFDEGGGATGDDRPDVTCPNGSPCGQFVVSDAVKYAKEWGKPERNPNYPDFGANNCTNFLSQIMAHGGMAYMRPYEHGDGSWWVHKVTGPKGSYFNRTESWDEADVFPRHLWQYGLADIDTSNEPSGWQAGDILAEDWYGTNGKGDFNHVQFVSGTESPSGQPREPLIANSSEPAEANYAAHAWREVKLRIQAEQPDGWNRVPLVPKHRFAIWNEKGAKKHDPANLYTSNGVFQE
ncbi:MAG: amidase domain-containing protein [Solirubrobacterales bacterium]